MKTNSLFPFLIHVFALLAIQILLLINFVIPIGSQFSFTLYIYPLIVIILPLNLPKSGQLLIAFIIGIIIDYFYNSPGVHSGALVFATFLRPIILRLFEPRGGYRIEQFPISKNYGLTWFYPYCALFLFFHLLVYFSIDAFSFVYILKILVNTVISFIGSFVLINLYQLIIRL